LEVVGRSAITGKFQVTLPKSVREFLGADNGDFLVFIKDRDAIVVKRGRVEIKE
jgi:AbrB family looped-hinge helix DNA binding protein